MKYSHNAEIVCDTGRLGRGKGGLPRIINYIGPDSVCRYGIFVLRFFFKVWSEVGTDFDRFILI